MPRLHHYPLCPHSRFARLALSEYGLEAELAEERIHERRAEFLALDPAGQTPVLVDGDLVVPGAGAIMEYLDETYGAALGPRRLLPEAPAERVEARRLAHWFNGKFFTEASQHFVHEKVYKRYMPTESGGGAPDMDVLRAARHNIRHHLHYIGYLAARRTWLAGERLTFADLAAAAHVSVADFLGDAPWAEDEDARHWYATIKSRPSFRPLLADRLPGLTAAPVYADLDF